MNSYCIAGIANIAILPACNADSSFHGTLFVKRKSHWLAVKNSVAVLQSSLWQSIHFISDYFYRIYAKR
jgi:hypothetical protein